MRSTLWKGSFWNFFVVQFIKFVRLKDTGIGGGKFWQTCRKRFGEELSLGYNRFYDIIEPQIPQRIFFACRPVLCGRRCSQWASSQLAPVPQSASRGTCMKKAASISSMTMRRTDGSSSGRTLKLSSSCT